MLCRLLVALWCVALVPGMVARPALAEYAPNEVLVFFEASGVSAESEDLGIEAADESTEEAMAALGLEVVGELPVEEGQTAVVATLPEDLSVSDAIAQLEGLSDVTLVQPNYRYRIIKPTLTEAIMDGSMVNASAASQANLVAAHVPAAWNTAGVKTRGAISVAVLDTGCRLTHEDLRYNPGLSYAWDYTNGARGVGQALTASSVDGNGDDNGHGTHVCGIIAAKAENGIGINGASYDANIVPIKVADNRGEGYTSDIIYAISRVRSLKRGSLPNLRVMNLSMGGDDYDEATFNAIADARQEGILFVCSAGNEANDRESFPSDYANALSVMALDEDESFAGYTSYNEHKDIAAVGTALSTYNSSDISYELHAGTSMASPLVASVAALVLSANPELSAQQVEDILLQTARAANPGNGFYSRWLPEIGHEIKQVDAYAAVVEAQRMAGGGTQREVRRPEPTSYAYDGQEHVGVPAGAGYTLSGTVQARAAGSYEVQATLEEGFAWANAEGEDATAALDLTWEIAKAPLTATYLTKAVPLDTPWENVSHDIEIAGFVDGETTDTVFPNGNGLPVVAKPDDYDEKKSAPGSVCEVTLSGGEAANYEFAYVPGRLVIGSDVVLRDVPAHTKSFVYDGKEHRAVKDGDWYTLGGTVRATDANGIRKDDAGNDMTGPDRYETYQTTVSLVNGNEYWSDGTQEPKTVVWTITKAPLRLTYPASSMPRGGSVPTSIAVTGFVAGQSAASLAGKGFRLPGLRWQNIERSMEGIPLDASVKAEIARAPGEYTLIPDPFRTLANAYDATANYEFTSFNPGTLHVYETANVPVGKTLTFNGTSQTGIASGCGYVLSGTCGATNVGTYTAYAVPSKGYVWKDGRSDRRAVTWRIKAASLGGASISSIGTQKYTGFAITPAPTLRMWGKTLRLGTDYTLSYKNNVAIGTATVTATGKGNYAGTRATTFAIQRPGAGITYRTHVQNIGWQGWRATGDTAGTSGRSLRLEALEVRLAGAPYAGGVRYRTHVQNVGWQGWRADGQAAGTSGRSLRLEALELSLTGEMAAHYDVWYRVHAQDVGWMGWARNGQRAGTATYSRRLEALQVLVLPKGSAAPSPSHGGARQATASAYLSRRVSYRTHVQSVGWQGARYDGQSAGTTGRSLRLEGLRVSLADPEVAGGVRYRTHVQNVGWQGWRADGALSGTTGRSLRLEAVRIELTGQMAARYDVWYRVHAQVFGWMGWARNGQSAGTAGYSRRLEALQVVLVPKGGAAPGPTANAFRQR